MRLDVTFSFSNASVYASPIYLTNECLHCECVTIKSSVCMNECNSRHLLNSLTNGLLELVTDGAEVLNDVSDPHPHLHMF